MHFKAKIRSEKVLVGQRSFLGFLWKDGKQPFIDTLRILLSTGMNIKDLALSNRSDTSYELSTTVHGIDTSVEYVFRLKFAEDSQSVEFDIDLYARHFPQNMSNPRDFNYGITQVRKTFENLAWRLTNRLANRFKAVFRVEKISAVVPLPPKRFQQEYFTGKREIVTKQSYIKKSQTTRDLQSAADTTDMEYWLWYLYLQNRTDVQVYDLETRIVSSNPFCTGENADFVGVGNMWKLLSESETMGPVYSAQPREITPEKIAEPVVIPESNWNPNPPPMDSGWRSNWTTGNESVGSSGGYDGGSSSDGGSSGSSGSE